MTCRPDSKDEPGTHETETLRITANNVAELEAALTAAVDAAIPAALATRRGIRITRVAPGEFGVRADPDVPCGYTLCATQ